MQRIDRALVKNGERLKTPRTARDRSNLGDYYTLDLSNNFVVDKHIDLESYGRLLNVLKPWETLALEY
jgi:hypothetical protein